MMSPILFNYASESLLPGLFGYPRTRLLEPSDWDILEPNLFAIPYHST